MGGSAEYDLGLAEGALHGPGSSNSSNGRAGCNPPYACCVINKSVPFFPATGGLIDSIASRGIGGNYDALVNATSQGIEATANYVSTHDANQIAFDVGNVAGDQLPGFVLTAGAGTTLRLGGEAIGALGGVASDGLSAAGGAFINGLSGSGVPALGAQVGAINLDAFSPVARAGLRTSVVISPERATQYLLDNIDGLSLNQAQDLIGSFDGPITARLVRPGEDFGRYANLPEGQGSFLTKQIFPTPQDAVDGLYLEPYGNEAIFRQPVVSTQRSIVLEGGIANGGTGIKQTFVINRGAFNYGTGIEY